MLNNIDEILKKLEDSSTDSQEKNRLALLVAETKDTRVLPVLHRLITDKDNENYRGTFVYALQYYPSEDSFELCIELLMHGNWEVAHEAFIIIDAIEYINGNHVLTAYNTLLNFYSAYKTTMVDWRAELLQDILELFE